MTVKCRITWTSADKRSKAFTTYEIFICLEYNSLAEKAHLEESHLEVRSSQVPVLLSWYRLPHRHAPIPVTRQPSPSHRQSSTGVINMTPVTTTACVKWFNSGMLVWEVFRLIMNNFGVQGRKMSHRLLWNSGLFRAEGVSGLIQERRLQHHSWCRAKAGNQESMH